MTEPAEIFDSSTNSRVPDTKEFFHYDNDLETVLMKSPIAGWEVFEDVDELADAVDELDEAVEKAKENGMAEYRAPFSEEQP